MQRQRIVVIDGSFPSYNGVDLHAVTGILRKALEAAWRPFVEKQGRKGAQWVEDRSVHVYGPFSDPTQVEAMLGGYDDSYYHRVVDSDPGFAYFVLNADFVVADSEVRALEGVTT